MPSKEIYIAAIGSRALRPNHGHDGDRELRRVLSAARPASVRPKLGVLSELVIVVDESEQDCICLGVRQAIGNRAHFLAALTPVAMCPLQAALLSAMPDNNLR